MDDAGMRGEPVTAADAEAWLDDNLEDIESDCDDSRARHRGYFAEFTASALRTIAAGRCPDPVALAARLVEILDAMDAADNAA